MNEIIATNNGYAITFNYHPSESQLFEDTLLFLIPILSTCEAYAYSIEKDDTPYRHIHIFLSHKSIYDKQKVIQKIMPKKIKEIKNSCKETLFDSKYEDKAIQIKQLKEQEDKRGWIGYLFKDNPRRQGSNIIDQDYITESVKIYHANERLDKTCIDGWKPLTSRNFHDKIEQFCKKQGYDVSKSSLHYDLIRSRHTFLNLTSKQLKMGIAELKFAHELDEPDDITTIDNYCLDKNSDNYVTKLEEKLASAQNLIRSLHEDAYDTRWFMQ
jgi:hypothetical protein